MSDIKEMLLNPELRDKPALKTEEVEIDGVGLVTVRAITRAEGQNANRNYKGKPATAARVEIRTVQMGLVQPQMTEEEVTQWCEVGSFGEFQNVMKTILKLSGMAYNEDEEEDSPLKAAYKSPS